MQPPKQFGDVEFRAKDLIIHLKNEGFSGFQIQIIGTQLWDAGAIMAFDAARLGPAVPPLPRSSQPSPAPQAVTETTAGTNTTSAGAGTEVTKTAAPAEVIPAPAPATPNTGGDIYTCTKCFGTATEKEKNASNLFFNKTLCRNCFEKERIALTREREVQVQAKKTEVGKT